ncbi:MAG: hypothetical protein U1F57_10145 [bacterium]
MIPILLGIAAVALFAGCSRNEEAPAESRSTPNPLPSAETAPPPRLVIVFPQPQAPPSIFFPAPQAPVRVDESLSNFAGPACNPGAGSRPREFALRDPRGDFCRLHAMLTGRACELNPQGQILRLDEGAPLPDSLSGNFTFSNLNRLLADPSFRQNVSSLQGISIYLYGGRPCALDGEADLVDMIEAYTLYSSARREMRQAFDGGRVGCVLTVGTLSGDHQHEEGGRLVTHHESHSQILTAATRRMNPGALPPGMEVSSCGVLR